MVVWTRRKYFCNLQSHHNVTYGLVGFEWTPRLSIGRAVGPKIEGMKIVIVCDMLVKAKLYFQPQVPKKQTIWTMLAASRHPARRILPCATSRKHCMDPSSRLVSQVPSASKKDSWHEPDLWQHRRMACSMSVESTAKIADSRCWNCIRDQP